MDPKRIEYVKRYQEANREKIRARQKERRANTSLEEKILYKEYMKKYREENKNEIKRKARETYKNNSEVRTKQLAAAKLYRQNNKEKLKKYHQANRERHNELQRERRKNPNRKLAADLRSRLAAVIGRKKSKSALELVGCTVEELRKHIESQWLPGMSWSNHTKKGWHIDHIRPVTTFDLTKPDQLLECFHYSNLRPLWYLDNLSRPKDGSDLPVPLNLYILEE